MGRGRWGVVKQCVQWCCQTSQHCCKSIVIFVPLCSQISQRCCGRRIIFVPLCSQNSHNRSTSCSLVLSILTKPAEAHLVRWCSQFSQQLQKHILFAGALNSHNNCRSTPSSPVLSKFSHPEMTQCGWWGISYQLETPDTCRIKKCPWPLSLMLNV